MKEEDIKKMELHEEVVVRDDDYKRVIITRVLGGYLYTTHVVNSRSEWNGKVLSANRTETFVPLTNL